MNIAVIISINHVWEQKDFFFLFEMTFEKGKNNFNSLRKRNQIFMHNLHGGKINFYMRKLLIKIIIVMF